MKHILVEIEVSDHAAALDPAVLAGDITVALAGRDASYTNPEGSDPTPRYWGKARVLTEEDPI